MTIHKRTISKNKKDYKANSIYLLAEKPYLLHPEIDKPESFFKFDSEGEMFGIDREKRGEETIKICNLNSSELKKSRQEIVDKLFNEIKIILASYDEGLLSMLGVIKYLKITFDNLKEKQNIKYNFSLIRKYIFDNFETLIIPLFMNEKQRYILIHAYQLYQKGAL